MSESDPPLIAECPSCRTRFRVTVAQLAVANGQVRCGACLAVFDGREALVKGEEPAVAADDPMDVLLEIEPTRVPVSGTDSANEGIPPPPIDVTDEALASVTEKPLHPILFATAIAAALALLGTGILVLQYEVYVQNPVLRDIYERVGVEVPRFRALDAIDIADPTVDERLGAPEGLIVRLDLTNTAPRYQRFPTLAVRFQRADGTFLSEQRVEPAAYLPSPTHTRRMTPDATTSVSLPLADPGPAAVGYAISLL